MKPFYVYDSNGSIVRTGTCPEDSVAAQQGPGETSAEGIASSLTQYVLNGVLTDYTADELARKSSLPRGYVWNVQTRQALDLRTLEQAKADAWSRIKAYRDTALTKPFQCNGNTYDSNVENISGAVQMALLSQLAGQAFTINWTLADNTVVTLDGPGMIAVGQALGQNTNVTYSIARSLRDQINSASTNQGADAVSWTP